MKVVQVIEYYYFMCRLFYLIVCWSRIRSPSQKSLAMSFNVYFHLLFNSRELNTLRCFGMKSFRNASLDSKKENKLKPFLHMRYNAIIRLPMRKLYGPVVRICLSVKLAKNKCIPCLIFEAFKAGILLLSPQARNAWF